MLFSRRIILVRAEAVLPGHSVGVTVTLSTTAAAQITQPGRYTAQLGFQQDTPYPVTGSTMTMHVTAPPH